MTNVVFHFEGADITGFNVSGHSGLAEEGEDILCASVSSAVYMAANTITDVIGYKGASISVSEGENPEFVLALAKGAPHECRIVLEGLRIHLLQLSEQYPDYLKIK